MSVIWKFSLPGGIADIDMPDCAQILHVEMQHDDLCLWALCDPKAEKKPRRFAVFGTGHEFMASPGYMNHIGTALANGGNLVWHVFELTRALTPETKP